jgi:lipopolysaccharide export system permease protein
MIRFPTLFLYIGRQFLFSFAGILAVLGAVVVVFEFVEFVRQTSARVVDPLRVALLLTAFKVPSTIELIVHFAVLIAAMFTFWRMTRSQELVVARGAGLSAWQFVAPILLAALVIGAVKIAVFNPMAAALFARYEQVEAEYLDRSGDVLDIGKTGFWLRQREVDGIAVIHADRTRGDGTVLEGPIFLLFTTEEAYRGRIDAAAASLADGVWTIVDAWVSEGAEPPVHHDRYTLKSTLTGAAIEEHFASPQTISFWDLPDFVNALDATGFSSLRYRIAFQSMLAQPLLMAAMVVIAAAFATRPGRRTDTLVMVIGAIISGFLIFVVGDIIAALGRAGTLPPLMAAWAPAGVAMLIGTAALLHLEDG